jgi:Protein of unknown function (DUF1350)
VPAPRAAHYKHLAAATSSSSSRAQQLSTALHMSSYARDDDYSTVPDRKAGCAVTWKRLGRVDVVLPQGVDYPLGVVHFIGGQAVGALPRSTYGPFLEGMAKAGFVVLATPIRVNDFNHQVQCVAA